MDRRESSHVKTGSAVNDSDVGGSALADNGASNDGSVLKLVKVCDTLISAGSALASTDSGSAVKKPLTMPASNDSSEEAMAGENGSALNEPSPAEFGPTPKRKLCNADIGRNNVSKRALYGATCIVRSALFNAQYDVTAFSDEQIKLMVEAEAAMTRLVDSWQKLPGSWQNREKNKWSRKSTSLVPTRVKHER